MEFFKQQGFFLVYFEDLGPIDYGRGAAPWFNMGRPSYQLFLNGDPSVAKAALPTDETLKREPSYAAVMANQPSFFPFLEYSKLGKVVVQPSPDILATIELLTEVRICRACDVIGFINSRYTFGSSGSIIQVSLLQFVPSP
jgi:hypothetical protein